MWRHPYSTLYFLYEYVISQGCHCFQAGLKYSGSASKYHCVIAHTLKLIWHTLHLGIRAAWRNQVIRRWLRALRNSSTQENGLM